MSQYVAGSRERIFINPSLGCDSNCSYCYLGSQGMETGVKTEPPVSAKQLFDEMIRKDFFVKGRNGTVISIGCFSECWSASNKEETIEFIRLALYLGNPIQAATKRQVTVKDVMPIYKEIKWHGQLAIFISCATISDWRIYEKGTARPSERFKYIRDLRLLWVEAFVYIKPVIKGVTIHDKEAFMEIVEDTGCSAVVGSYFVNQVGGVGIKAPIPSKDLYIQESSEQMELIKFFKSNGCAVFESSVEAMKWLKENGNDR